MDNFTKYRNEMTVALTFVATIALLLFFSGPKVDDSTLPSKPAAVVMAATNTVKPIAKAHKAPPGPAGVSRVTAEPGPNPTIQFPVATELTITIAGQPNLAKVDAYRNPLDENAKAWNCVVDRSTGLVWEVKTNDRGLQDASHFYSWYNSDALKNLGNPGYRNNGTCRGGIACDTESYVQTINKKQLCGYADWRLPTKHELMSLVQYNPSSTSNGLIDKKYFPNGSVDWYWSSDTDADDPTHAWFVLYYNGRLMKAPKNQAKKIRLVRGGEVKRSLKNFADGPGPEENSLAISDHLANQPLSNRGQLPAS